MEKVFKALAVIIVLLLIVATVMNFIHLIVFGIGLFFALGITLFFYRGEIFAGWLIIGSILATIIAFIVWFLVSISLGPLEIGILFSAIGGAILPAIVANAHLESRKSW